MSRKASKTIRIDGTVAPGFESVKTLYEHNMRTLIEKNTQLCVYHQGEKVVDLWASVGEGVNFSPDSLVNCFSSGKSLEAIAMASLAGKGLLDYNAKIADYWPEFGTNGKEELTVAELMRHEAGLAALDSSIEPHDLLTENIKQNKVGKIIEAHAQTFREGDGSRREYHAVTRGWIVNEVFRRIDPTGRTIGEFLREDISGPLEADVIIGVKEDELHRVVKVSPLRIRFQFFEGLKPKFMGRRMERNILQTLGRLVRLYPNMRKGTTKGSPAPLTGMDRIEFFNEIAVAKGETPSANANCSARGLAKIAAMMSSGGKWAGSEYLNDHAWNAMHSDPVKRDMGFSTVTFSQGGVAEFTETSPANTKLERAFNAGREGFHGWMGLGGSIFQWHPQQQIGFAYVPTSLNVLDIFNERGKMYQTEVLSCVEKLLYSRASKT
ncbi:MAG: CubicO group peptidase (beta-lactamase class C family) [Oceanicoccus sp.]|jgi:CubicO group peptidase (beta-lactamase class C family)